MSVDDIIRIIEALKPILGGLGMVVVLTFFYFGYRLMSWEDENS